jgi:beta-phosphoglucomutase
MHLQAIIFDFDGVIADSEHLHLRAFQDVLGESGIPLAEADYSARYLGLEDADVFRAVARDASTPLGAARLAAMLARKTARYQALIASAAVVYPGVEERVRDWSRHVPLAIASGALRAEIDTILACGNLAGCFTAIVAAEDVARGKPAPDAFLEALRALDVHRAHRAEALCRDSGPAQQGPVCRDNGPAQPGSQTDAAHDRHLVAAQGFSPARVVVIEDSVWGLQAARTAGMRTVAVTTNHPADVLTRAGADLIAASVGALDLDMLNALVQKHP